MTQKDLISPLSLESNVQLVEEYETEIIIKKFKKSFGIDVSSYFDGLETIQEFECLDSGYHFYYPYNISGKSELYLSLMKLSWYYMPWKWEHGIASKYINRGTQILEVGCGKGDFLKRVSEMGAECTGLELNQDLFEKKTGESVKLLNESIEQHSTDNHGKYDIVCGFQVLEHISNVYPFLESMIKCLRKNGKLIISVPNNDSFPKYNRYNDILNLPPHHMGLWNNKSLRNIPDYFDIELEKVKIEPLQRYHIEWYMSFFKLRYLRKGVLKNDYIIDKIIKTVTFFVKLFAKFIRGHTILVVYTKK